jgi:hypothetical protein
LKSECPGHKNTYDLEATGMFGGGSRVAVNADEECTNHAPGECPVEFSADGGGALAVVGPMQYWARHVIGSGPDELQRKVEEPLPDLRFAEPPPSEESGTFHQPHDHHERAHYTGKDGNGDATQQNGDDVTFDVFNSGLLDVGFIVPKAVWPETGRVSSYMDTSCEHGVTLTGKMQRTECIAAPCCGGRQCFCNPAFDLDFARGRAVLTVEGKKHEIHRQPGPPKTGIEQVWVLK